MRNIVIKAEQRLAAEEFLAAMLAHANLIIAAPKAISHYEHIGMTRNERCFAIAAAETL